MALADSSQMRAIRRFFPHIVIVLLFFVSAWGIQKLIFNRALSLSLRAAQEVGDSLYQPSTDSAEEGYFFPLFPFSSEQIQPDSEGALGTGNTMVEGAASGEEVASGKGVASGERASLGKTASAGPLGSEVNSRKQNLSTRSPQVDGELDGPPAPGPLPKNVRADEERVLSWANSQMVLQGRTAQASFGMPAGIELFQVTSLGIGLRDRDRLIAVDGVPISNRAEVVAAALGARGRQQEVIVATLVRNTQSGPVVFQVFIDQPYLTEEEIDAAARSAPQ